MRRIHAVQCIVMHMTDIRSPSPEPAGTPGARCCACSWATPASRSARVTAGSNAGEPLGALQPHLLPLADRVLAETTVETLAGHDVVVPGAAARPVRPRSPSSWATTPSSSTAAPTSGSPTPAEWETFYGGDARRPWPYGLPELPGQRDAARAAPRRIAVPGCYPTVSTLALAPGVAAGLVEPDVVVVAASGTSGAGKAAEAAPARQRDDGQRQRLRRRRHAPAHPRDRARTSAGVTGRRCGSASPRPRADARGILATVHGAAARRRHRRRGPRRLRNGVRRRALRAPAARRASARRPSRSLGANTVHLQVAVDERARRLVAVGAVDNLAKGTAGAAIQCMNIALGLDEAPGSP